MTYSKNKVFFRLSTFFICFFGILLGLNNGNVLAVEDVTYNVSSGDPQIYVCGGNSSVTCSDFAYLIFEPVPAHLERTQSINLGGTNLSLPSFSTTILSIPSSYGNRSIIFEIGSHVSSAKITLTNTLGLVPSGTLDVTGNGTYDVTNYASVSINVPQEEIIEDPISNDFQKVFFKIVEKIIPAFGIFIVIWFGIDMISSLFFGRGK